ncbi:MAG TPA: IS701 family transposase [Chloroflexota bacterium]|nr:IS701 family transposase [Chloroflexota bacterium]
MAPDELQQLHHFVSTSPWKTRPVQRVLLDRAEEIVGGPGAVLIIDDTAIVKQGKHSVGVARQYCGELGKRANCQALVSLTLARGEVPVSVALELFLPKSWAADSERCTAAGVPEPQRVHRPKWRIALDELDVALQAGVRFDCVTADAEYGKAAAFRQALSERGLRYAVGIQPQQFVYPADVELLWPEPTSRGGRPRKHPRASVSGVRADEMMDALAEEDFRELSWRDGTQGPLLARFAALRVRAAEGPRVEGQALPGEGVLWLVCEWRNTGEKKYYLCNHAPNTTLKTLARHIKARWICEQAHEQLKNQLGLDHLECRNWQALHHHALLTCESPSAFCNTSGRGGEERRGTRRRLPCNGPPPSPSLPEVRRRLLQVLVRRYMPRCPTCGRNNASHTPP